MNFFGHAAVAGWTREATPAFVIGAMLPDFATISGARSVRATHPEAIGGVALHHATDAVFHAAPDFVVLTRRVREQLERGGIRTGSARAAAHVGVELLLDGTLVTVHRACDLYLRALGDGGAYLTCDGADDVPRLARFLDRLRGAGIPYAYADPRAVAGRVERALSPRPLLALPAGRADVLAAVLSDVAADVRERAASLLDDVRRGLRPVMAQIVSEQPPAR